MNETFVLLPEEQKWNEVYADIEAALADIDPDDREALYDRALRI